MRELGRQARAYALTERTIEQGVEAWRAACEGDPAAAIPAVEKVAAL